MLFLLLVVVASATQFDYENPNTFQCRDERGRFLPDSYNCNREGKYVDMDGLSANERGALLNKERESRETFSIDQYKSYQDETRQRKLKHEGFNQNFDKLLQTPNLDDRMKKSFELGKTMTGKAIQQEQRRLSEFDQEFPRSLAIDNSYMKQFGSHVGELNSISKDMAERATNPYSGANGSLEYDVNKRKMFQKYARSLYSDEQFKEVKKQASAVQDFVSRQRMLKKKYSNNVDALKVIDANIDAGESQLRFVRGVNGAPMRTITSTLAQKARFQQLRGLWSSRLYDPTWASPQKRKQAQKNMSRIDRALEKMDKLKFDVDDGSVEVNTDSYLRGTDKDLYKTLKNRLDYARRNKLARVTTQNY